MSELDNIAAISAIGPHVFQINAFDNQPSAPENGVIKGAPQGDSVEINTSFTPEMATAEMSAPGNTFESSPLQGALNGDYDGADSRISVDVSA